MTSFYAGKMPTEISFKILYLNRFKPGMLYTHILHTHPFVELFYVLSGEGFFMKDEDKIAIKKGDLMIINPGTKHCEYSSEENPLEFFVFAFTDISFELNESSAEYILISESAERQISLDVGKLFRKIYEELCDEKEYYLNMIRNYFEQLIIAISRNEGITLHIAHNNVSQNVAICMQYIDDNINKKLTLDDLAKVACVNKYTLIRQFKKEIGQTPLNYIADKKIKKAIELLYFKEESVEKIAEKLGFINITHFYQMFKRVTGRTPSSYMKNDD